MKTDPPVPDEDDALLAALAGVFRAQEAAADQAWPSADPALAPIEGAEADLMFDRIRARAGPTRTADAEGDDAPEHPGASVIAFPKRRILAAVVALAAGLLVFVLSRPGGVAPLPDYALTALTGDQAQRGDRPDPIVRAAYTPGSRILLVARPAQGIDRAISAQVHLRQAGAIRRLDVPAKISEAGAIRVDLVAGESAPMQAGEGELIVLVLPEGASAEAALEAADPAPAQRLVHPFVYRP